MDSSLHRITTTIDDLSVTAVSQKRVFVMEVCGSNCGHLCLMAAIACEVDAIFVPEYQPCTDKWRDTLCDLMKTKFMTESGRRTHFILVCEDAVNDTGGRITPTDVKGVVTSRLGVETVCCNLAAVQTSGNTSTLDRLEASRQGAAAVLALSQATPDSLPCVVGVEGVHLVKVPLGRALEKHQILQRELTQGSFSQVLQLTGRSFLANLCVYHLQTVSPDAPLAAPRRPTRLAMMMVGQLASGVNAAARAFVSVCRRHGYIPVFIYDGWNGCIHDKVHDMSWDEVQDWSGEAGSNIGSSLMTLKEAGMALVARQLAHYKLSGLVIAGGFEAYQSACEILDHRHIYPEFRLPVTVVPACISNCVPGCKRALGVDSALHQVCRACDELKRSAKSTDSVVNLVQVPGGNCGYLATMSALASGADDVFVPERPFSLHDIENQYDFISKTMSSSQFSQFLIICNETANPNITMDTICKIFNEEAKGDFVCRKVSLGISHAVQTVSGWDRHLGTMAGSAATLWLLEKIQAGNGRDVPVCDPTSVTLTSTEPGSFTIHGSAVPVDELRHEADFEARVSKNKWWIPLRKLHRLLSHMHKDSNVSQNVSKANVKPSQSNTLVQ